VKPQFEAGPANVGKGGVVRDRDVHRRVLAGAAAKATAWGAHVLGVADSGLPGPKGNREFFLYLGADPEGRLTDVDARIEAALG
jgi:23S rRNA (cytidine1920-2'-O)/16S rRNA (cytidine1409-2'-O)-methyltransferase